MAVTQMWEMHTSQHVMAFQLLSGVQRAACNAKEIVVMLTIHLAFKAATSNPHCFLDVTFAEVQKRTGLNKSIYDLKNPLRLKIAQNFLHEAGWPDRLLYPASDLLLYCLI